MESLDHTRRMSAGRAFTLLAVVAFVARVAIAPWTSHSGDMGTFIAWGQKLAAEGPARFWSPGYWCDYLPGYLHVLWLLGKIAALLPEATRVLLFKVPNILADIGTAWIIWRVTREKLGRRQLWLPAAYLLNPAIWINSTLWGQADSLHAFFLLAGLYLLTRRRVVLAGAVLGYAVAVKPHGVVLLPVAAAYALRRRMPLMPTLAGAALVPLVFATTFLPFNGWSVVDLVDFIRARIGTTMGQYGYATVNALNLWYLLGYNWEQDSTTLVFGLSVQRAAQLLCGAGLGVVLARFWTSRRDATSGVWEAGALSYLVVFLFVTRAHERHVFPYFALLAVACAWRRAAFAPWVLLSATYCANLALAWQYLAKADREMSAPLLTNAISVINLLVLPLTMIALHRLGERCRSWVRRALPEGDAAPGATATWPWAERHWRVALAGIMLFALVARVARLNDPPKRYFDEVYHAYTAEQWLQGNTGAWLWSTKAPDKGCSYEWTHPPLAKLMMAWSMSAFGVHPWVWRLPGALLGTLSVLLIFSIARGLFQHRGVALLSAAIAALDVLPLFASRIGMNDVYCVTFILLAVRLGLSDRWNVMAPVAVGVALACKWTALYALPLMAFVHLIRAIERRSQFESSESETRPPKRAGSGKGEIKADSQLEIKGFIGMVLANARRFAVLAVLYVVLAPAIYLGSYIPFFRAGHGWADFQELQVQMWSYHTGLKATHAYSSPAWKWPLLAKAVWCYTDRVEQPDPENANPQTIANQRASIAPASGDPIFSSDPKGSAAPPPQRVKPANIVHAPRRADATTAPNNDTNGISSNGHAPAIPDSVPANTRVANTRVANVYAWGNPIIWCAGLGAILFAAIHVAMRRDPPMVILLAGYLAFWFPWLMSPRIMFIYHYLPSLPFLYITLAWGMARTAATRRTVVVFLALATGAFVLVYPYVAAVYLPLRLSPTT